MLELHFSASPGTQQTMLDANLISTTHKIQLLNARIALQCLPQRSSARVSYLVAPLQRFRATKTKNKTPTAPHQNKSIPGKQQTMLDVNVIKNSQVAAIERSNRTSVPV
jgi:hypothetical protein